jgi:hypothetical protein
MIPGLVSKLSEGTVASTTSIVVSSDAIRVTGTTSIATIKPLNNGGFSGLLIIVPVDGNVATLTTGNIAVAVTMAENRATLLYYSKADNLWYPGAIS